MVLAHHRAGTTPDAAVQIDGHGVSHDIISFSAPPRSTNRTLQTHSFQAMLGDHTLER
jgi:hypothetical protein